MPLRRIGCLALALSALAACEPSLPSSQRSNPSTLDFVVFDPATSQIPLPNDLALLPTSVAATTGAQKAILQQFQAAGGFPNDQEVPVLIDVQRLDTSNGAKAPPPQGVDLATVNAAPGPGGNVLVLKKSAGATAPAPVTPDKLTFNYRSGFYAPDRGTLEIHNKVADPTTGSLAWEPGSQMIVVLRGGQNGVKLQGGGALNAEQTMFLLTRGADLSKPENQTTATRGAIGAQLEQLRQGFLPVFGLVEQLWGQGASQEIASIQSFTIAPKATGTAVLLDASASKAVPPVPIPSDLLLDPATNKVVNNPAFCIPAPDPATGTCPLAQGLATLDGFSTSALVVSGTNAPTTPAAGAPLALSAKTINAGTVFLYDLSTPTQPARVKEVTEGAGAGFVAEPPQLGKVGAGPQAGQTCAAADVAAGNCFSTVIGLQPAVPVPSTASPTGVIALPPLKEKTEYAVLITDGVKDAAGGALKRSSLSSILLLDQPLVDANGKSQIGGQPDAVAAGLEKMRQGVGAAAAALQAEKSITKDHVVLGYTFRTQTVTDVAVQVAAVPYATPAAFAPGAPTEITGAPGLPALPAGSSVFTVPLTTLNAIDPATGAFRPDPTQWKLSTANDPANPLVNAFLVAPPAGTGTPTAPRAVPVVLFGHGLGGDKTQVFPIANALASAGFVTLAFDEPFHGDRGLCRTTADCVCPAANPGCTPTCNLLGPYGGANLGGQLGLCGGGSTITAAQSGAFAISANPFLTRDGLRQYVLDSSAAILAVAPPTPASTPLSAALAGKGIAIDPSKVYWVGLSLGGIGGTVNVAAVPRISRAVLSVPGGTIGDIITTSPGLAPRTNALLGALGITPGSPQFLLFLNVFKWIVDPGDPLNFAGHILGDAAHPTLPNPLANNQPQSPKNVFGQFTPCDQTVPNGTNLELLGVMGLAPNAGPNALTSYTVTGAPTPPVCTPTGVNPHGFLLDGSNQTAQAQTDAVNYLTDLTVPTTNR